MTDSNQPPSDPSPNDEISAPEAEASTVDLKPRETRVDDEDSVDNKPESGPVHSHDQKGRTDDGVDLETVRMAAPRTEFVPIKVVRMVHDRGAQMPRVIKRAAEAEPLKYPEGKLGEWERFLAQGNVEVVRAALDASKLGELPDVSDEEAAHRDLLARVGIMDGDVDNARSLLEGIRDDDRVCTAEACLAVGEGDVSRAQQRARMALDRNPDGVVAHYVNALVCVAEGDYQRGFEELSAVARASEEHAVARHQLGQLTYATGDPARAGTLFEQAAEISPAFLPPSLTLAEMLIESRQYGEALAILKRTAEAAPDALAPRLLELRILLDVGDDESAVTLAEVLHRAAPQHPEVSRMWADAMLRAGREEEAKEALETILPSATGTAKAGALRLLAKVDLAQGNADQARERLTEAVKVAPSDGELVLEHAQILYRTGAAEDASETLFTFAKQPDADVGHLLSGAMLAREHGDDDLLAALATSALSRVAGTPSEPQVHAALTSMGVELPAV